MSDEYYITMLGGFSVTRGDRTAVAPGSRSLKPWNLLEYIISNRNRRVPQYELEELLWEEQDSGNPSGALKVLLHRARKILDEVSPDGGADMIILKRGEYSWRGDIPTVVDADLFSEAYAAGVRTNDRRDRDRYLSRAVELYKGDYLEKNNASWVMPIASHYHNMFIDSVKKLIRIIEENADHSRMIALCEKAIAIEGQEESFYHHLIYALYMSGRQEEALERYREVTDLFYSRFAITPSEELKDLYRTIMRTTQTLETDINVIKENLTEHGEVTGAFECEYGVFKDVYQLEARACARSGDSIYLCLVTLESKTDEDISQKNMNNAMQHLERAISETLRKGDVFSRFSVSQYVILLPAAQYENVGLILKRITTAFNRKYLRKDLKPVLRMQPIEPKV